MPHSPLIIEILLHISNGLELLLLPLSSGHEPRRPHLLQLLHPLPHHPLEPLILLSDAPYHLLHGLESVCVRAGLVLLDPPLQVLLLEQVSVPLQLRLLRPLIGFDLPGIGGGITLDGVLVGIFGVQFCLRGLQSVLEI